MLHQSSSRTTTCTKHLCSQPVCGKGHSPYGSSSSRKSGTCDSKSCSPLCGGRPWIHLLWPPGKMTLWGQQSRPSALPWWLCPAVNLSAAFILRAAGSCGNQWAALLGGSQMSPPPHMHVRVTPSQSQRPLSSPVPF